MQRLEFQLAQWTNLLFDYTSWRQIACCTAAATSFIPRESIIAAAVARHLLRQCTIGSRAEAILAIVGGDGAELLRRLQGRHLLQIRPQLRPAG